MRDCPVPAERLEALGFVRSRDEDRWERPASADGPAITVLRATEEMQEAAARELGEAERPHWLTCWMIPPDATPLYVPFTDEEGLRVACGMTGVELTD